MVNALNDKNKINVCWEHVGVTSAQKGINLVSYASSTCLTALLWHYTQPSLAMLCAGSTAPLIALCLKVEEILKEKEVKKGWLERAPIKPLLLGALTVHTLMLAPIVCQALHTTRFNTRFAIVVEKTLLPSLILSTQLYLLTKTARDAAQYEEETLLASEDEAPLSLRETLKETAKFTVGSTICLAAVWISSQPMITNALALGGLCCGAYIASQVQENAAAEWGVRTFNAGVLTSIAFVSTALLIPQLPLLSSWRFAKVIMPSSVNMTILIISLGLLTHARS